MLPDSRKLNHANVITPLLVLFLLWLGTLEQLGVKSKCRHIILYRSPQLRYRAHMPRIVCF
jgi:hypothetical protein